MQIAVTDATSRGEELLISFGLSDHLRKTPDQLSGRKRRRVAVARALANDPPVILADEPTAGLDSLGKFALLTGNWPSISRLDLDKWPNRMSPLGQNGKNSV